MFIYMGTGIDIFVRDLSTIQAWSIWLHVLIIAPSKLLISEGIPGVLYGLYSVDSLQKVFDERNASIIGLYGPRPFSGSH